MKGLRLFVWAKSMRGREWLFLSFSVLLLFCKNGTSFPFKRQGGKALTRIAFGSCANQSVAQVQTESLGGVLFANYFG